MNLMEAPEEEVMMTLISAEVEEVASEEEIEAEAVTAKQ